LDLGLGQRLLRGGTTAGRSGTGTGPHPHPVLRHPLEIDQPLGHQHRDAPSQQPIQEFAVGGAEFRQVMVIDADVTEDPLIVDMAAAQRVELSRTLPIPSRVA
jgi:hypothetical protein